MPGSYDKVQLEQIAERVADRNTDRPGDEEQFYKALRQQVDDLPGIGPDHFADADLLSFYLYAVNDQTQQTQCGDAHCHEGKIAQEGEGRPRVIVVLQVIIQPGGSKDL